jgi:hypothetical protein
MLTTAPNTQGAQPLQPTSDELLSDDVATAADDHPLVRVRRRTIDKFLIGFGVVAVAVLALAGALLTWGHNFAQDYVGKELRSQQIFFPDAATLQKQGRDDLVKYAGEQLTTGQEAQAYASFINGHLDAVADGQTYAQLGAPETAAKTAVTDAKSNGASDATVADLQAKADGITAQRNTLFKGETLRGLLLSTYAWSTIATIAGIAAIVSFVAAVVVLGLVIAGFVHLRRSSKAQPAHAG